jgi:hypothetical protein
MLSENAAQYFTGAMIASPVYVAVAGHFGVVRTTNPLFDFAAFAPSPADIPCLMPSLVI